MDKLIYTAGSGAKHILERQATAANNLANVNTTGFRAQIDAFRAVPVVAPEGTLATRTLVVNAEVGTDVSSGPLQMTGRDLDVAVRGNGWIALQMPDGSEAYTRHGALQMNANGLLLSAQGHTVAMVGDGLNDGPVLARAHVSMAVGPSVPLAQAQADLVMPSAPLLRIGALLQQSKRTMQVVRQNLLWALLYNVVCVPLAISGSLPAWLAGLGMALSSLWVVLN
eukprot:gene18688-37724_t